MFLEFLTGAGVKIVGNVITSIFANSAEKERALHLRDKQVIDGHIRLAQIHSNDNIVKFERMCVFFMLVGSFCWLSLNKLDNIGMESVVLVEREVGFITRFFTSATKKVPVQVSTGTFIFEIWCNIIVMVIGSYMVPPRK